MIERRSLDDERVYIVYRETAADTTGYSVLRVSLPPLAQVTALLRPLLGTDAQAESISTAWLTAAEYLVPHGSYVPSDVFDATIALHRGVLRVQSALGEPPRRRVVARGNSQQGDAYPEDQRASGTTGRPPASEALLRDLRRFRAGELRIEASNLGDRKFLRLGERLYELRTLHHRRGRPSDPRTLFIRDCAHAWIETTRKPQKLNSADSNFQRAIQIMFEAVGLQTPGSSHTFRDALDLLDEGPPVLRSPWDCRFENGE